MLRTPLLRRINAYLRRTRISAAGFGRAAAGDPRLVSDLRAGRQLRPRTEQKLVAWLDAREREQEDAGCSR